MTYLKFSIMMKNAHFHVVIMTDYELICIKKMVVILKLGNMTIYHQYRD